jgi:hypothetical protein
MSDVRWLKIKSPAEKSGGAGKALICLVACSVAQFYRPAAAGMVVPVVMRETEHLPQAYFRDAAVVK